MDARAIAHRRMASVLLAGEPGRTAPADVVRWFGARRRRTSGRPSGRSASGCPAQRTPRRASTKDTLLVEVRLYRALAPAEAEALDAAAGRQAAFLGLRPQVDAAYLTG